MAGNVKVVLSSVFDDAGIKSAQSEFAKVGKTIGGVLTAVGAAVAVAGVGIAKFGADSVKSASTLEESLNAVNVAYGSASKAIVNLGEDAAQRLGVTQAAFNAAAVRFSAFAERVVGAGGDVTGFIDDITTRAADFASVFNIDVAEALQVFQSGLSGEAEPLKRFGINLLDSEVKAYALEAGLIAVGETMTEQQKVQARYGLLMESTAKTQGDFANTSDSLANSQRILKASFEDLQAEVGTALLPVFADATKEFGKMIGPLRDALVPAAENLAIAFRTKAIPAIQDFTKWLASPDGTKRVNDFVQAIVLVIEKLLIFTVEVIDNWEAIKNQIVATAAFIAVLQTLKTTIQLTTAATLLFSAAVGATPIVTVIRIIGLLAAAVTAAGIALAGFAEEQKKAREESTGFTGRLAELVAEQNRLKELVDAGVISYGDYKKAIGPVNSELAALQGAMMRAAGAGNALNKVSIGSLRGQLSAAAGEANRFRNILAGIKPAVTGGGDGGGGGGGTGPTLAEQRAEAAKQFASLVKDTKAKLAQARSAYQKAVNEAGETLRKATKAANDAYVKAIDDATTRRNEALEQSAKDNAKTVESITKTYSARLADVVRQSIDRLRSAYASAVAVDVSKLFGEEAVGKNVDKLVQNLRDKLAASRRLVQNASELTAQGFSQTFVEQIVGAGTDAGNELSQAILAATPETQAELKSLFGALETESETGMDALSKAIYEKAGLATTALKSLYSDTQSELTTALSEQASLYAEQQAQIMMDFNEALAAAKVARNAALLEANQAYSDAITAAFNAYKEELKAIEKEYKDKLDDIKNLSAALKKQAAMLGSQITTANEFVPRGIQPVNDMQLLPFKLPSTQDKPASTVNINVKVDPTTSIAQVGQKLATTIQKYTAIGGGAGGSAMPWQVL
jgi:hypothetical protein